jgi:hypothetical protein
MDIFKFESSFENIVSKSLFIANAIALIVLGVAIGGSPVLGFRFRSKIEIYALLSPERSAIIFWLRP